MLRLVSKTLPDHLNLVLKRLQAAVNEGADFASQRKIAKDRWSDKGGAEGKRAFAEIREILREQCVFVGICPYCEQNEAGDIEHIYPKSFFPELAFVWENHLLVCKTCNTQYKLDKCYVLINEKEPPVILRRGEAPPSKNFAFINPKSEDPTEYMLLNLQTFKFEDLPDLDFTAKIKFEKTIEILALNERDTLVEARRRANHYYYSRFLQLVNILSCETKEELLSVLTPNEDLINHETESLDSLKAQLKDSFKKDITRYKHPSVWRAIQIIGSKTDPKWQKLFDLCPEALDWA